jgi:hypothetical protein
VWHHSLKSDGTSVFGLRSECSVRLERCSYRRRAPYFITEDLPGSDDFNSNLTVDSLQAEILEPVLNTTCRQSGRLKFCGGGESLAAETAARRANEVVGNGSVHGRLDSSWEGATRANGLQHSMHALLNLDDDAFTSELTLLDDLFRLALSHVIHAYPSGSLVGSSTEVEGQPERHPILLHVTRTRDKAIALSGARGSRCENDGRSHLRTHEQRWKKRGSATSTCLCRLYICSVPLGISRVRRTSLDVNRHLVLSVLTVPSMWGRAGKVMMCTSLRNENQYAHML